MFSHSHPGLPASATQTFLLFLEPVGLTLPQGFAVPSLVMVSPREQNGRTPHFLQVINQKSPSWWGLPCLSYLKRNSLFPSIFYILSSLCIFSLMALSLSNSKKNFFFLLLLLLLTFSTRMSYILSFYILFTFPSSVPGT